MRIVGLLIYDALSLSFSLYARAVHRAREGVVAVVGRLCNMDMRTRAVYTQPHARLLACGGGGGVSFKVDNVIACQRRERQALARACHCHPARICEIIDGWFSVSVLAILFRVVTYIVRHTVHGFTHIACVESSVMAVCCCCRCVCVLCCGVRAKKEKKYRQHVSASMFLFSALSRRCFNAHANTRPTGIFTYMHNMHFEGQRERKRESE